MNCGNCGNENEKASDFCSSCGTKLNQDYDSSPIHQNQTSPPQHKPRGRLYRSRDDRWIGGVAGGFAEYYDIDSNIVRLIIIIAIFAGPGFFAYLVAWLAIPENPVISPRSY